MGISIWKIIGIEATSDISAIRKAYAAKVKLCRPDEDPEGFGKLREAYESALNIAKQRTLTDSSSSRLSEIEFDGSANNEDSKATSFSNLKRTDVVKDVVHPPEESAVEFFTSSTESIYDIFGKMEELYHDFFKRIEIKNWEDILKSDYYLDIQIKTSNRPAMLHFFAEHPVLPKAVWVLMDQEFGWTDNMSGMPAASLADYAVLKEELDPRWDLDFTWFQMYEPSQDTKDVNLSVWTSARLKVEKEYRAAFPEYAKLRRDLRSAMYAGKYSLLKDIYYSAVLLFPDDPDIHRIYFEYYKRNGDIETPGLLYRFPEDVIRKLRELCPDNPEYEAASADLLLRRGDYYKAADAYSKLVVRLPDHLDIAYHYGLVLKYLGDDKMSRQVINGIRNHYQDTQSKLKKGESYLKDRVAIHYQMARNDLVMQLCVGFPKEISPRKQQQRYYLIAAACIIIWFLIFFLVSHLKSNALTG